MKHLSILLLFFSASEAFATPPDIQAGSFPLLFTAYYNHSDATELLLRHGAEIHQQDGKGNTALHQAARKGHTEITRLLLEYGANPDTANRRGNSPLHQAANYGQTATAELLLEYKANPCLQNILGNSPLHVAAYRGHSEIVLLLLQYGANPSLRQYSRGRGRCPCDHCSPKAHHMAKEQGHTDIENILRRAIRQQHINYFCSVS